MLCRAVLAQQVPGDQYDWNSHCWKTIENEFKKHRRVNDEKSKEYGWLNSQTTKAIFRVHELLTQVCPNTYPLADDISSSTPVQYQNTYTDKDYCVKASRVRVRLARVHCRNRKYKPELSEGEYCDNFNADAYRGLCDLYESCDFDREGLCVARSKINGESEFSSNVPEAEPEVEPESEPESGPEAEPNPQSEPEISFLSEYYDSSFLQKLQNESTNNLTYNYYQNFLFDENQQKIQAHFDLAEILDHKFKNLIDSEKDLSEDLVRAGQSIAKLLSHSKDYQQNPMITGRSFSNNNILSESNPGIAIDYNDMDYLSMLDPEIDWDSFLDKIFEEDYNEFPVPETPIGESEPYQGGGEYGLVDEETSEPGVLLDDFFDDLAEQFDAQPESESNSPISSGEHDLLSHRTALAASPELNEDLDQTNHIIATCDGNLNMVIIIPSQTGLKFGDNFKAGKCDRNNPSIYFDVSDPYHAKMTVNLKDCHPDFLEFGSNSMTRFNKKITVSWDEKSLLSGDEVEFTKIIVRPQCMFTNDYIVGKRFDESETLTESVVGDVTVEIDDNIQFEVINFQDENYEDRVNHNQLDPFQTNYLKLSYSSGFNPSSMISIPTACYILKTDGTSTKVFSVADQENSEDESQFEKCSYDMFLDKKWGTWSFKLDVKAIMGNDFKSTDDQSMYKLECAVKVCPNFEGNSCQNYVDDCNYQDSRFEDV